MTQPTSPNLVIVIDSIFPSESGGREALLYALCRELQHSWTVTVLAMRTRRSDFYPMSNLKVELVRVPAISLVRTRKTALGWFTKLVTFSTIAGMYLLLRFGTTRKPTTLVVMHPAHLYTAIWALRGRNHRRVVWTHGNLPLGLFPNQPLLRRLLERWQGFSLRDANAVIASGPHNYEEMKAYSRTIESLPNFIDCAAFERVDVVRDPRTISFVATLTPDRGILHLMDAVADVRKRHPVPFRVIVAGKGDIPAFKELARTKGIDSCIEFLGEVRDVGSVLCRSAISVCIQNPHLGGRGGGISVASIEAMAAGNAVIAWDSNQYSQVLSHMKTGFLVPLGDIGALSQAIVHLLDNPELVARLGQSARATAGQYDIKRVAPSLECLLAIAPSETR